MHNVCRSLEQRWSFQQATVVFFVGFSSVFQSVDGDIQWWIMAADGMPLKLLRLSKVCYTSTKTKVRAN